MEKTKTSLRETGKIAKKNQSVRDVVNQRHGRLASKPNVYDTDCPIFSVYRVMMPNHSSELCICLSVLVAPNL